MTKIDSNSRNSINPALLKVPKPISAEVDAADFSTKPTALPQNAPAINTPIPSGRKSAEWALHWLQFGFSVIPIYPGQKSTAIPWDDWLQNLSPETVAKYWQQHPAHELGLIVGDDQIVFDADSPDAVSALEGLEKSHGVTPSLIVKTKKGVHHYFRRAEGAFAKSDSHSTKDHPDRIDIKTGRALVVLPGSVHKTIETLTVSTAQDLSEVGQDIIDAVFLHNGRTVPRASEVSSKEDFDFEFHVGDLKRVAALIAKLDPDEGGYDDWIRVGMAIYHESGGSEEGLDLFDEWSQRGAKYAGRKEIEAKWRSFNRRTAKPITIGTLNMMVEEAGYDWKDVCSKAEPDFEICETEVICPESTRAVSKPVAPVPKPVAPVPDSASTIPSSSLADPTIEELNARFAYIEEQGSIYRLEFGDFIEPAKFRAQFDNRRTIISNGNSRKSVGLGSAWVTWPKRRDHKSIVLRPSEPSITGDNCLNEWSGFATTPAQGTIKPFVGLMLRLIPNRLARRYIQKWMAHLIQKPGLKMFVSLAIWSHAQGVGKNLLFECLTAIIGAMHATIIGQEELNSSFNGWANRKIFVIGDEVSGNDKRQQNDKLKGLITGTSIHINEKYQPGRELPNLLNFVFLSNHHDALFLSDHDRRYYVWEIEADRLPEAQAIAFVAWRDSGGLAALHHFLLTYPLGDFNPRAPAPMTAAKSQMAEDNRSDLESWLADLLASDVAAVVGRELATANELARMYAGDHGHSIPSSKAIVGACKRQGVWARPSQVRLAEGKKVRVLALTRVDFWKPEAESEWSKEMAKPLKYGDL